MVLNVLAKQWFLIGIVTVILLAKYNPEIGAKGGLLVPEVTVKYVAVSLIFFNSGLSLRTEDLTEAILQVKLHLFVQGFTFLVAPFFMYLVTIILQNGPFDEWLLKGILVVGSMPPPVSSAVILTKSVGANEAGAIFNSAFGSFLGIFITPMWLLYFLGSTAQISKLVVFSQLSTTVVLPLIVGQIVRSKAKVKLQRWHIPFGSISSAILLLIIYTTFCDTFKQKHSSIDGLTLLLLVVLVLCLQLQQLFFVFKLASRPGWSFQPEDVVACMFCSTHKSLTLGIPILQVMFSNHPHTSILSLPLLVYHPTQILLGGLLLPVVRTWMYTVKHYRTPIAINDV